MKLIKSGTAVVLNSKFQDIAKKIPEKCADLVIADWPFNKGIVDISTKRLIVDGVKYAGKLLKPNGTFISVNYMESNFYVWKETEYWGLNLGDSITVLRHPMKKVKDRLTYETLSILGFYNGKLHDRTLNTSCRNKRGNIVLSKEKWSTTTNFWNTIRFKNGYYRKNGDSVSEAMPKSIVNTILEIFAPKNGLVIDFFGGAGTVPLACRDLDLRCISTEILSNRFQIIKRRLSENKKLVSYSTMLLDKALDVLNSSEPYTKGACDGTGTEKSRSSSIKESQIFST